MPVTANEQAWLDTIAWAEGTDKSALRTGYNILFGGGTFSDLSKHPLAPRAIQLPNGDTTSAAGRYQFERNTWDGLKARIQSVLGYVDFGPAAQDTGALLLTQDHGALNAVNSGDVGYTAKNLSNVWQGFATKSAAQIQQFFNADLQKISAGGTPGATLGAAPGGAVARSRDVSAPVNETARRALITAVTGIVVLIAVLMMSGRRI